MMKRSLVIIFLCLTAILINSQAFGYSEKEEIQLALQRSSDAQDYIESAWKIEKEMKDKDITEIVAYMQQRVGLAVPSVKNSIKVVALPNRTRLENLYLIPLYKSDAKLGGSWKNIVESRKIHAGYFKYSSKADVSVIILPNTGESSLSKGISLIHEGAHAFSSETGKFSDVEKDRRWCSEHAWIREIEGRILAFYGKDKYEQLLEKEARRIEVLFHSNDGNVPVAEDSYPGLKELFGSKSEDDGTLESVLWVNAAFRAIVRIYPRLDAVGLKEDMMCSMSEAEALEDIVVVDLK
jgi:hypothetical protein